MTPAETAEVLAMAAAFDRRTVGRSDVAAWHAVLGDLDAADVRAAVTEHYRDSRDWLMPADVRTRVKAIRKARLSAVPEGVPDADPDNPVAYIEALRQQRYRAASPDERPRPIAALLARVERSTVVE
jgi:hypothetical protein